MRNGSAPPSDLLDVIVRMHDPRRLHELQRAVFSLMCQQYRPLTINVTTQRFSPEEIGALKAAVRPTLSLAPEIGFHVWNFEEPNPADARSELINLGLARSQGRYFAFLDYDDTIYPEAYKLLVSELASGGAAIAFARIMAKYTRVFRDSLIVTHKGYPWEGSTLIDLFKENFCPIHSFIVDKKKVDSRNLYFDLRLSRNEDYEFLLRICSSYNSSFRLREKIIGDYYVKDDGSNTIVTHYTPPEEEELNQWRTSRALLEQRRREIVIAPAVQRSLGLETLDPLLTISAFIDRTG